MLTVEKNHHTGPGNVLGNRTSPPVLHGTTLTPTRLGMHEQFNTGDHRRGRTDYYGNTVAERQIDPTKHVATLEDIGMNAQQQFRRTGEHATVPAIVGLHDGHDNANYFAVLRFTGPQGIRMAVVGLTPDTKGELRYNQKGATLHPGEAFGQNLGMADKSWKADRLDLWNTGIREPITPKTFRIAYPAEDMLIIAGDENVEVASAGTVRPPKVVGRVAAKDAVRLGVAYAKPQTDFEREFDLRREKEEQRETELFTPLAVVDRTAGERTMPGYTGPVVTSEGRQSADTWIREALADTNVSKTVRAHLGKAADTTQIMDAIRTNPALRKDLGSLLLLRLQTTDSLPSRVLATGNKTPAITGYPPQLNGREYASLLALAHLDGTFNPQNDTNLNGAGRDGMGWPIVDQHRAAARWAIAGNKWDKVSTPAQT